MGQPLGQVFDPDNRSIGIIDPMPYPDLVVADIFKLESPVVSREQPSLVDRSTHTLPHRFANE